MPMAANTHPNISDPAEGRGHTEPNRILDRDAARSLRVQGAASLRSMHRLQAGLSLFSKLRPEPG